MDKPIMPPIPDQKFSRIQRAVKSGDKTQIRDVSLQFETMFATQLVREMRQAMAPGGLFGEGPQSDYFQSMLDDAIGTAIAEREQLGIAALIRRQLEARDEVKVDQGIDEATRRHIEDAIQSAARQTGVSADLINAVIQVESNYDPNAVSPKGAKGLMQLMDQTALQLDVSNSFDIAENVRGGARYLKSLMQQFSKLEHALAAYNAGPSAVERYKGIPPYQETQRYVEKIMALIDR